MNKKLFKYELYSSFFIIILGTILHFSYSWSNNNYIIGIFSSINESTWEHLKLIFFPMLICSLVGSYYLKIDNYLCTKTKYIIYSLISMIIFFYSYSGIIGKNYTIINILSFYIISLFWWWYSYYKIKNSNYCNKYIPLLLIIMCILFFIFTFYPPHINLFLDPVTYTYGIKKLV